MFKMIFSLKSYLYDFCNKYWISEVCNITHNDSICQIAKALLFTVRLVVLLNMNQDKEPKERSWTVKDGKKNPRYIFQGFI